MKTTLYSRISNHLNIMKIKLNGKEIQAQDGQTILEAAAEHGVKIPTLCYHKDLNPSGSCRMCVVDVKGSRLLQTACTTQVWEGMELETDNTTTHESRKLSLEMMLANHPQDCITCEMNGNCELQDLAYEYKAEFPVWGDKARYAVDSDPNPFVRVDMNRCILCGRCVQACAEIQVRDVWGFAERGFDKLVVAGANTTMLEAGCESCGQCVAYCPTGALTNKVEYGMGRAKDVEKVKTTCTYCGVGCQFDLLVKEESAPVSERSVAQTKSGSNGTRPSSTGLSTVAFRSGTVKKIIGVESNPEAPVNGMALCVKGRYGWEFIHHEERLTKPRVRRYLLTGESKPKGQLASGENPLWDWVETSWDQALQITAEKLHQSKEKHGADSLGILTSAKCTNEENYLMNKFARQVVGTNNIDHCARL